MFCQAWIYYKWLSFLLWMYRYYPTVCTNPVYTKQCRQKLESLGILGIKLGQYLCNRPDMITAIMKKEFSVLLSNNKIHPLSHTKALLRDANMEQVVVLGEVIGSGSLAQVYRCSIGDDHNLVLKINHPEVSQLPVEIDVMKKLIKILGCMSRFTFIKNMDWDEFFSALESQIDMTNEIANLQTFRTMYKDKLSEITIPRYVSGNKNFIIMTYCEGKTLNHFEKDDPIYQKAHNLFVCSLIHTGFVYRFMHGDIHEGNILVKDNGDISIIDFGVCMRLSEEQFLGILSISKFEIDPSYENCESLVEALIHEYTIDGKTLDIPVLAHELYDKYKTILTDRGVTPTITDFFDLVTTMAQRYRVLIRGNIMAYFMNVILLEGLSPFSEDQQMSSMIALAHMKRTPFFVEEGGAHLEEYYQTTLAKTFPYLIEKYNLKV